VETTAPISPPPPPLGTNIAAGTGAQYCADFPTTRNRGGALRADDVATTHLMMRPAGLV
jgi:hypothetical protein